MDGTDRGYTWTDVHILLIHLFYRYWAKNPNRIWCMSITQLLTTGPWWTMSALVSVCVCRQKSFPRRVCPSKPSFSSEMSAHGAVPLCSVALLMMLMEKYTTADKKNVTYGVTTEVRLCWERMNCTSFAVISHKKFISYGITNMRQVIMCHCASNYMCC